MDLQLRKVASALSNHQTRLQNLESNLNTQISLNKVLEDRIKTQNVTISDLTDMNRSLRADFVTLEKTIARAFTTFEVKISKTVQTVNNSPLNQLQAIIANEVNKCFQRGPQKNLPKIKPQTMTKINTLPVDPNVDNKSADEILNELTKGMEPEKTAPSLRIESDEEETPQSFDDIMDSIEANSCIDSASKKSEETRKRKVIHTPMRRKEHEQKQKAFNEMMTNIEGVCDKKPEVELPINQPVEKKSKVDEDAIDSGSADVESGDDFDSIMKAIESEPIVVSKDHDEKNDDKVDVKVDDSGSVFKLFEKYKKCK